MKNFVRAGVTALLCAVIAAPAAAGQNREHQQLAAEARMLQEQAQQLAIAVAALNESLKAITARIDETAVAGLRGFANQKILIDNMAGDVRVVRERTDDTNLRIATLREELEALRSSMIQLQQVQQQAAAAPVDPSLPIDPAAPAALPPAAPAPLPSTVGLSPTRMLDTAKADFFAGQFSLAVAGFEAFLKAFPRSESAGEAQFYIGESYAAENRWTDAIAAYNAVIQNAPSSGVLPEAYYKRGLAEERSGQIEAAQATWETVVKSFPESDGARLAGQSLDRLSRRRPAP